MARETITTERLTDDVDGGKAVETITFTIEGVSYEIDLSTKNARAIRSDFAKWAGSARKVRKATATKRKRSRAPQPVPEAATIRAWAAQNGIEVPARGRIPQAVTDAYHAG